MRGYWGVEIAAIVTLIPAIGALVLSNTIENIKQENDLATYKEILAFMNGEAEIERDPRALPRRGWASEASSCLQRADNSCRRRHRRGNRLHHLGVAELTSLPSGQDTPLIAYGFSEITYGLLRYPRDSPERLRAPCNCLCCSANSRGPNGRKS